MSVAASALPSILGAIRPRPRWRELWLLAIVAVTLTVGAISLGATLRARDDEAGIGIPEGAFAPYGATLLAIYLGALLVAHLAQVVAGRRTDQVLLPTVGLIGGLSLLVMERLPQRLAGQFGGLAQTQLVWLLIALTILTTLAIVVRSDSWLRLYKYTWAAAGIALLLLTFVFGSDVAGQRLIVFLAGYLSENRALLVEQSTRLGPIRLPPLPYLAPMVAMWAIALLIVVVQRDLGAALLFFAVFLLLLYIATSRWSFVILGLAAFAAGFWLMYQLFGHVQQRVDIWLDPFADPRGAGYQIVMALYAFGRGGILGTGLGNGLPTVGGGQPGGIPEIHTDFPLAAIGEELGLIGILALLGLYLVLIERGLRIAAAAADAFRALLAAGLSLVVGVQAFIIAAGNLKLVPLTGITLPFVSYGGTSVVANFVLLALLLLVSDRASRPR
jgi:cell division protein FtsW (lipid II flippase)